MLIAFNLETNFKIIFIVSRNSYLFVRLINVNKNLNGIPNSLNLIGIFEEIEKKNNSN